MEMFERHVLPAQRTFELTAGVALVARPDDHDLRARPRDQARLLERAERLPVGRPADLGLACERALGWDPIALGELARDDPFTDHRCERLVRLGDPDRLPEKHPLNARIVFSPIVRHTGSSEPD